MTDLSPVTNHDAQEALSRVQGNSTVMLVPLTSGNVAVFGRDFTLHEILDTKDWDPEDFFGKIKELSSALNQKLFSRRAEAAFYGEPDDKTWKRDTRAARRNDQHLTGPKSPPKIGIAFDLGEE